MNLQEKVDQAYEKGKQAYYDGLSKNNPYSYEKENHEWLAWNEGYYNAQHE